MLFPIHPHLEAHVEHTVGLVEDEELNALQAHNAPVNKVQEPARRGYQDIASILQTRSMIKSFNLDFISYRIFLPGSHNETLIAVNKKTVSKKQNTKLYPPPLKKRSAVGPYDETMIFSRYFVLVYIFLYIF